MFNSNKRPLSVETSALCHFTHSFVLVPVWLLPASVQRVEVTLFTSDVMFSSSGCLLDGSQAELQMMACLTAPLHQDLQQSSPLPSSNHTTADPALPKPIRRQLSLHGWHVLPIKKNTKTNKNPAKLIDIFMFIYYIFGINTVAV